MMEKLMALLMGLGGLNGGPVVPFQMLPPPNFTAAPVDFGPTTPYHLIRAEGLIKAPLETPEEVPSPEDWPRLQAAFHTVGVRLEVIDERETRYIMARVEDFERDLELVRRRYQELKDAPPLSDSEWFPSRAEVNDRIAFNRYYLLSLEQRQLWEPEWAVAIGAAINETHRLYKVWDAVRDAKCEFYYVTVRRRALLKLQKELGPNYASGELPPHVPYWRFVERSRR